MLLIQVAPSMRLRQAFQSLDVPEGGSRFRESEASPPRERNRDQQEPHIILGKHDLLTGSICRGAPRAAQEAELGEYRNKELQRFLLQRMQMLDAQTLHDRSFQAQSAEVCSPFERVRPLRVVNHVRS